MQITVRVVPRSSKNVLEWSEGEQGVLKARLTAPPVDGAANEALVALLSERLQIPKRAITLVRGVSSRQKTLEIAGLTLEELKHRL